MVRSKDSHLKSIHPLILFISVTMVVFLSRLPFLGAGYGNDWDSWEIASAARDIAATGKYTASRLPGYPVPELFYSLIWDRGPLLFNAVTAMFSAVGIGFFSLTLSKLHAKDAFLASISLAFIPVVYINSTVTLDYVWALTFILVGLYFAQHAHGLISGLFLGLAIGSRITSALMFIPLGMSATGRLDNRDRRNFFVGFSLSALLVAVASYIPVVTTYGVDFLTFSSSGYPPLLAVLRVFTFDVWGGLGLVAIGIPAVGLFLPWILPHGQTTSLNSSSGQTAAWLAAIALYVLVFFRFPHEAGYLMPVLPFVILLLARFQRRSGFVVFCVLLMFSPFFFSVSSRNWNEITGIPSYSEHALTIDIPGNQIVIDPLYGPLLLDHRQRVNGLIFTRRVLEAASLLDTKSIVVAGAWLTKIQPPAGDLESVEFVYLIESEGALQKYLSDGFQIFYLPGQLEYNRNLYGIDLEDFGANVLDIQQ